ncbi:hypothetical protein KIPE111705_20875 [Kibdelosporangium persicum]|uniref:hypothetical protein n=1 Tax=Kibdelosporangium persicum TaxID=2698649 RepID=UPI0015632BCD|nr:hypothetical protein [Kibdelosporangium persicum]
MTDENVVPDAPGGISANALAMWTSVLTDYELRDDETEILRAVVRQVTLVEKLETALADSGEYLLPGSHGGWIANPLLGEIRMHRTTMMNLWKSLKLPNEEPADEETSVIRVTPMTRSEAGRKGADARWANRGA